MGYRSDAVLKLKKELFAKFEKFMVDAGKPSQEFLLDAVRSDQPEITTLIWEGVKFYEYFPEISNLYKFLHEANPENFGFIRIGEEFEDCEERGSPWDFGMYVSRNIDF